MRKAKDIVNDEDTRFDVVIYTDGGCYVSSGIGGWGAIYHFGDECEEICGASENTTNNRMELTAILESVTRLPDDIEDILIFTDSKYAQNVSTGEWNAKKNLDLVDAIKSALDDLDVEIRWVKGHNGNKLNERADDLASEQMKRIS